MKISYKISTIIIVVSIVLLCVGNMIFSNFFTAFLINEEKAHIKTSIDSFISNIHETEKKYITIAGDWGYWDETYDYINSNGSEYEKINLNKDSIGVLNANIIIIFDKDNKIVNKVKFDLDKYEFVDFPSDLVSQVEENLNAFKYKDNASFILKHEDEFYIIATSAVTDSLKQRPANGTFVIGKLIDKTMLANFENITNSKITFSLLKDIDKDLANALIKRAVSGSEAYVSVTNDKNNVVLSHMLIPNLGDGKTAVVNFEKTRGFYLSGIQRLGFMQISYSLFVLIIIIFLFLSIRKYISMPILNLAKQLKDIDLANNKFERLPKKRNYEFAIITDAINSMLDKIETTHNDFEINENRLLAAQMMAHVGNWELDLQTKKIWASEEAFNIYGIEYTSQYLPLDLIQGCVHLEYRNNLDLALTGLIAQNGKYDEKFKIANITTGEERFLHSKAKLVVDDCGNAVRVVGTIQDITDYKMAEEEILYLSYHDQITGVYNRRYYEEELKKLDNNKCVPLTLVMIDVNGLKLTNDAFGHKAGDLLLEKVANVLKKECRKEDIVARIGGDEFVLLLPETAEKGAEKIISRINVAIENEKVDNIILSISIGFAVKKDDSDTMDEVYKKAEDEMYRHKLSESSSMRSKTIDLIMNTLYEKNNREMLHSKRVGEICAAIATKMDFDKDDINQIRIAGLMHDIGKIGIDEKTLNKPRKLNSNEWYEMERHSEIGYRILSSVNEFSEIAEYVLEHHERWSGDGYPKGLKGKEISVQARIIAVADAFDAMTSDRTYREALSEEEAIEEIKKHSGTQFDPYVSKIFIEKVLEKL